MVLKSEEAQMPVQHVNDKLKATPVRMSDSDHSFTDMLRNMARHIHLPEYAPSIKEADHSTRIASNRDRFKPHTFADKFSRMLALL